jgi:hypothetical protein
VGREHCGKTSFDRANTNLIAVRDLAVGVLAPLYATDMQRGVGTGATILVLLGASKFTGRYPARFRAAETTGRPV